MALPLISGFDSAYVLADKGYDSQEIVDSVLSRGAEPVIPPRRGRKEQRLYDKHLYKARHLVENAFLRLKEWRGVATRYAKRADSFLAIVQIRCMTYWLRVICGASNAPPGGPPSPPGAERARPRARQSEAVNKRVRMVFS
jgi:transposase